MGPLLIFLLSLYHLQSSIHSEILNVPDNDLNSYTQNEDDLNALLPSQLDTDDESFKGSFETLPFIKTGLEQTEVAFTHPISSVNIDYSKNMIVLKFRKQRPKLRMKIDPLEEEKRRLLEENFMRFGRSPADFMRLGKRQYERMALHGRYNDRDLSERQARGKDGMRDSRGDSFMRFGRSGSKDFLRFGRTPADFMRFGRAAGDFMRFGRNAKQDFMRFGRAQKMRRETDLNFMRFGRPDNFMRFGRSPPEPDDNKLNFMRFGRNPNFMRFGKSLNNDEKQNNTNESAEKSSQINPEHTSSEKDMEAETNPMDKAIKLFNKQQEVTTKISDEGDNSNDIDLDLETDYIANAQN